MVPVTVARWASRGRKMKTRKTASLTQTVLPKEKERGSLSQTTPVDEPVGDSHRPESTCDPPTTGSSATASRSCLSQSSVAV